MKAHLVKLRDTKLSLTREEAREVLLFISEGKAGVADIASLLTVYLMRPISLEELTGYRDVLLHLCNKLPVDVPCMDVCGTGGDQKNTFNISTLSAFVVAACGVAVAKHGNYGASSVSGSSDVLSYLGYKFTDSPDTLKRQLSKFNICFMHAPLFHPALKTVAPIRKEFAVKTFFNMLGPLINPAQPSHKMVGVYNLELARTYHYLLQQEEKKYCIVHSLDGYDEISCTDDFKTYTAEGECILSPSDFKINIVKPNDLSAGHTVKNAATIFLNVLQNRGTKEQSDVVALNSAYALNCFTGKGITECLHECREALYSGKVYTLFTKLIHHQ